MAKKVKPELRGIAFPDKNGVVRVIAENIVVPDDDPAVKAHPDWFVDIFDDPWLRGVEQATASPGERRNR